MSSRFRPVIRVFVSSTFSDLKEERNALQREVFPRLEHYCLVRGFQFQAIDLRWGVPGEAGRDHRTMQICFDELRRAQKVSPRPNFLVLLGDRYGWQPLAETITETEFRELERNAGELDNEVGRDLQAGDSATQTLRTWYCRDDNAVPAEFQLRSRNEWPDGPECSEEEEELAWRRVEETLWSVINRAFPQETLAGRFGQQIPGPDEPLPSVVKFQASATEQEIWRGALAVPDAPEHVVAWYRTIRNSNQYKHDPKAGDFFDSNEVLRGHADELKDELRQRLRREGRPDIPPVDVDLQLSADGVKLEFTRDHLQLMCGEIESRLREIIDEEIRDYWRPAGDSGQAAAPDLSGPGERRKLELETQAHQLFGESRAPRDGFVGRDQELKAIADYLGDENGRNPLVVHGPSGTGKTALLARAAQLAKEGERRIFARFLGTTPQSSNLRSLLQNLCRALRPEHEANKDIPPDLHELQDEFDRLLAQATAGKPILLFLDALDQLDEADGARQTYWLRTPLPPHVKVVASCIRDEEGPAELNEPYRCFDRRNLLNRAIAVESLTATDAIRAINLWLRHDHRRPGRRRQLTQQQLDSIAARITPESATACRRPLYLRILFEECRLWPSWKTVEPAGLGEDTAALLNALFTRLAQPTVHGALLVESVFAYIASARRGLSESEMLEVLWADPDYKQHLEDVSRETRHELPPDATRIPIAIWSRLRHDLDPYLAEQSAPGGVVLNFYHRVVGRVVAECFLRDAARRGLWHERLVDYFQSDSLQPWWRPTDGTVKTKDGAPRTRMPNARRASELPWALQQAALTKDPEYKRYKTWDAPASLLCDMEFVEAKCSAGLVFELQEDYELLKQSLPEAQQEFAEERRRDAETARWTRELIVYSAAWSDRRDREALGQETSEPEPILPVPLQTLHIWNNDAIEKECNRIKSDPNRQDRVIAFAQFVQSELDLLLQFDHYEGFVLQHASNYAPRGPVHDSAHGIVPKCNAPMLIRRWPKDADWNPKPALLRTLEGHSDWVTSVSMTPAGQRAVSGGGGVRGDNMLRVWDLESGACLRILEGHSGPVNSVSVTPDGRLAVSASGDSSLRVWDLESGACLRTLNGGSFDSVSVTPDGRRAVSGGKDNNLRVWDLASGACLRTLEGHSNFVTSVSVTPCGRRAISGSWDRTLRVWDLESGTCLCTLEAQHSVYSLSVTPDARRAVSGGGEILQVWDLESGACLRTLRGHQGQVVCVCLTPDGQYAVSGGGEGLGDHAIRVWDVESGNCLRALEGHNYTITSVSMTPNALRAVSSSQDESVRMWDLEKGYPRTLIGHGSYVWCVSATQDGRRAVSGSRDRTLRVWDFESAACLRTLEGHKDSVEVVCVTPDGSRAVSGSMDQTLRVWDLESGACLHTLRGHREDVTRVCVTPDSWHAVSASQEDSTLRLWDLKNGVCEAILRQDDFVFDLTLSSDGWLVVSAFERALKSWDLKSGAVRTFEGHTDRIWSVRLTSDGRRAVSGSLDKTVRVWDLESGACLRTMGGHNDGVWGVAVAPDGRSAVSGSKDKTVRVWDLETGACLHTLEGHRSSIYGVSVTTDGQRVLSRSGNALRVWDLKSGSCLALLSTTAPINSVADTPTLVAIGTQARELLLVETHNMPTGPAIGSNTSDAAHEALLRRGLDIARNAKGSNHEETLAHRTALATLLNRMGRSEEARELRRENERHSGAG